MKKEYGSPELEKLALEDEDLERVSGGAGGEGGSAGNSDIVIGSDSMGNSYIVIGSDSMGNSDIEVIGSDSMGNSDIEFMVNGNVGRGRGRGGGCDGEVPLHRSARTFSNGRRDSIC